MNRAKQASKQTLEHRISKDKIEKFGIKKKLIGTGWSLNHISDKVQTVNKEHC